MRWPKIYYNIFTQRYEFVLEEISKLSNKYIIEIDELFRNLEEGKVSVEDIDWAGELWEIVKINRSMDMFMQSYCWLYPLAARVRDYDLRIDILERLKEFSTRYFSTVDNMLSFIADCEAMITIIQHIKHLPVPDYMLRRQLYDEKQWIRELTLAFTQTTLAPRLLAALAQGRYNLDLQGKRVDKLASIVLSIGYIKKCTINSCVDFCKYMFVAEGYRQYLICGDPDYDEIPTMKTLDRKLRNACFDIYIQTRFEALQKEMDEDNTRLLDPSDVEVNVRLYEEERMNYEQARANNSIDEEVLVLVSYLLKYLKLKIPCPPEDHTDLANSNTSGVVERGVLAVFLSGLCEASDWAAVVKIMEERNLAKKAAYDSDAQMINDICGRPVTNKNSIARSVCMSKVKGIYPNWEIRNGEETRETPNKLKHYKEIAGIFVKALDA